jgi:hypothetical protein
VVVLAFFDPEKAAFLGSQPFVLLGRAISRQGAAATLRRGSADRRLLAYRPFYWLLHCWPHFYLRLFKIAMSCMITLIVFIHDNNCQLIGLTKRDRVVLFPGLHNIC